MQKKIFKSLLLAAGIGTIATAFVFSLPTLGVAGGLTALVAIYLFSSSSSSESKKHRIGE